MRNLLLNLFYGAAYVANGFKSPIVTSGKTPMGRDVYEGQEWFLEKDINTELREGVFIVKQYGGDRIVLVRKDGRHDLSIGCLPIFDIGTLDDVRFSPERSI